MLRIDQVRWQATANISRFREFLNSPLDAFQRQQLKELLARDVTRRKAMPYPQKSSGKPGM